MEILLKQSSIVIPNYNIGDCKELEDYFTLFDKVTYKTYPYGMHYDEDKKELIIPRGVDISLVEKLLNRRARVVHKPDPVDHIIPYNMKVLPRNDAQKSTIKFLAGIDEYSYNDKVSQLSVNLDTGAGKTYCSVAFLGMISCRGLIITSSSSIIQQWCDRLYQYTDIKRSEILILNSSQLCIRVAKHDYDMSKYKVVLATHSTLRNFAAAYGWNMVGELFKKLRIGVKFYDECHKDFVNMYYIDFYTNTYKTIYISATLNRSSTDEDFIFQLYLKNVPYINRFNAEENRTEYIALLYSSNPEPRQRSYIADRRFGLNRLRYIDYIVNNDEFYKMCMYIFNEFIFKLKSNEKCLIYIGTNEAIVTVFNWIYETFPSIISDVGVFSSIHNNRDKYENLNKRIILTTTKSAGEAIDIPNLKMTIVLAEPFKSRVIAKQSLGRTRDNNTIYIEVVDQSFRKLIDFYNFKKCIFEKHATGCHKTLVTPPLLNSVTPPMSLPAYNSDTVKKYIDRINQYSKEDTSE